MRTPSARSISLAESLPPNGRGEKSTGLYPPAHETRSRLLALLEEAQARAGEHGLGLGKRLHLLVEGRLLDLEVIKSEVARLVQVRVLVLVLLLLVHGRGLGLLSRGLVGLRRRLLLGLVRHGAVGLLDGLVRVLHERLVRLLRIRLRLDRLRLQRLRIGDDLLDHAHHTASTRRLLVLLEPRRRRRARRLLLGLRLNESLLVVDRLQHVQSVRKQLLRGALVRDGGLEVGVLRLAVLTRALQLNLHVCDARIQLRDLLRELVDRRRQVRDLGIEAIDVARLQLLGTLIVVDLLDAEILHLDVVRLLLLQVLHHAVDRLGNLREGVETDARRKRGELRVAKLLRSGEQDLLDVLLNLHLLLRHLHEVERARERVVGVVRAEDGEGLAAAFDLLSAGLLALLPLGVGVLASLLKVHQELLVRAERVARVVEILLGLGVLRVRISELLLLGVALLRAGLDLGLLSSLQGLVGLLGLHLLLLGRAQVRLEGLLHLLEDAEDLARLRRVALLERGLRIEVVPGGLDEGSDRLVLGRGHHLHQGVAVLVELPLQHRSDVEHLLRRHLGEGVVLAEDGGCRLQRADGLEHVLLLRVELGQLLLADRRRLVKRRLVLRDLGLEVLDLGVEAGAVRGELLNACGERGDLVLSVPDRHRLRLVVRLAPARNFLVDLLVLNGLLLELRLHVLQQVDHLRDRAVLVLARGGGRCLSSNEQAHQQQHRVNALARINQTLEPK